MSEEHEIDENVLVQESEFEKDFIKDRRLGGGYRKRG